METLEEAILWLHPDRSLLHDCLGIGEFAEVTITSDGYFVGRLKGDCGFNSFLGRPSEMAKYQVRRVFAKLSPEHRTELVHKLRLRGIPPQAIGIPEPLN